MTNPTRGNEGSTSNRDPIDLVVNAPAKAFIYEPNKGPLAGWRVDGEFDLIDGVLAITRLAIGPSSDKDVPAGGVTSKLLKEVRPIRYKEVIALKESGWLNWLESEIDKAVGKGDVSVAQRLAKEARTLVEAPKSRGPAQHGTNRLSDEFLRRVYADWAEEVVIDGPYGAIKRLAQARGKPYETVKDWLKKAKKREINSPHEESESPNGPHT